MSGAQAHLGCLGASRATQASGLALWQGWGLSWRAGLSLAAAGLASPPLPGVGAEQGSERTVRRGATTLHLQVGSQGSVLARAPLGGGQGIWKDSRGVGSRRASGALKGPLCFWCPASEEAKCPARTGQDSSRLPGHVGTHPLRRLPAHPGPGLPGAGLQALQGCRSPPAAWASHPISEHEALQSTVGQEEGAFTEEGTLEQVPKWELVVSRRRDWPEQRHGGGGRVGGGPGMTRWWLQVTGHQAMLGRDLGLEVPGHWSRAVGSHGGSLSRGGTG